MRTFVKYNKVGDILSVCRTDFISGEMKTPFGELQIGEFVLEIKESESLKKLASEEIHDLYKVDTEKDKLVKKR